MNRNKISVLLLVLLSVSSACYAGWESFDAWESRFLSPQPYPQGDVLSYAVYGSLALPLGLTLTGAHPLRDSLTYGAAAGISWGVKETIKQIAARPRPNGDAHSYAFPSGHATGAGTAVGYLLYLNHSGYEVDGYLTVSLSLQGLVIAGRYLSRSHYPTDLVAGTILGTALGYFIPLAADMLLPPR